MGELTLKDKWLWAIRRTRQLYYLRNKNTLLEELLCEVAEHNCDKCIMKVFKEEEIPLKQKYCLNRYCLPYSNTADILPTEEEEKQILAFLKLLYTTIKDFHGVAFTTLTNSLMNSRIKNIDKEIFENIK